MSQTPQTDEDRAIWEEIMRSPLEPDPEDTNRWRWLPVIASVVVGLVVGYALGGSSDPPIQEAAVETPTPATAAPVKPDPIFPPGYTGTTGVAVRPLASFAGQGNLFLIVSSATRSDLDRTKTSEFHVAEWVLAGEGDESVASRAVHSDFAPGVRLVEFPNHAPLPISGTELQAREATEMVVRSGCNGCAATSVDMAQGEIVLDGAVLPYRNSEPIVVSVGSGISLSIDQLHATGEWGFAAWRLLEESDARARVSLFVVFEGTDDPATDDEDPTMLIPAHEFGPSQQNPVAGNPGPFSKTGLQQLDRVGEILTLDNQPERLVLRWTVEWQHPVGEPLSIAIEDPADLGSLD